MFHLNCLQICIGLLSFFVLVLFGFLFFFPPHMFLAYLLQNPTHNYVMKYCGGFFLNVLIFKEFAINVLRLISNCM